MRKIIVGIDEAGRGPLAGPVVASAFCIIDKPRFRAVGDFDSKKLKPEWRENLYKILTTHPQIEWGIGQVSEKIIDQINIFQATRLAMQKAFFSLNSKLAKRGLSASLVIIDGISTIDISTPQKAVIRADASVFPCMAASIIAKVTRDRLMLKLHEKYPLYGFDRHKGYGTKLHFEMLKKHGPCPIHRFSFTPCNTYKDVLN